MQLSSKDERKRFKELLCHPRYGLCIYITENQCNKKFIVLRPDEFDLELFLEKFCDTDNEATNSDQDQLVIDNEFVEKILVNMDTEWDKNIVRVLLSLNRSRAELDELGIESDHIVSKRQEIQMVLEERSRAEVAAKDILKLRLESQKSNINKNITESEVLLEKKSDSWTKSQLDDLREEIEYLKDRSERISNLLQTKSKCDKVKFNSMVKREKNKLIINNRLGLRALGSGRKEEMDETDENFLLTCIQSKATAHGRRHDSVLYLNHRVKKKDLLKLVNHSRAERGLGQI